MENELTPSSIPAVGYFSKEGFELSQRIAKMICASTIVPKLYSENIGNTIIAVNMAYRMNTDPLMVMQNLYVVNGIPSWSAKFLISAFNLSGRFSSIRYEFFGTEGEDDWGCRAISTELATGEKMVGPKISLGLAKREGWYDKKLSKWPTMPELMMRYRAASWLIKTVAPEIALGLGTREEAEDAMLSSIPQASDASQAVEAPKTLLDVIPEIEKK